ncbi:MULTISPECIES: response regulator transcription factor [unclassified Aeromicrobium]|uniref:response regulator transcription factor n=1 Tax=unclassified Aeromicrobium TaxID=2633570 RepID=UPI00288AE29E|nr:MULTISPECIES: response regulator transcription factor [unclassified Aeromicrobium]
MGESSARLAVVIEDDADVRHLLRTILVRSGFEVILTKDGAEGVEAVRAHDPELTTLDVNMPGMDGFAAAKLIREFSSTYIIMLTGLDDEIDVVQGLDSGADDYLVKPFRPRELRARIESVMRRPRQHVTTTAAAAATDRTSPAQPQQWAQPAAEPTRSDAEQQHLPQREVAPSPAAQHAAAQHVAAQHAAQRAAAETHPAHSSAHPVHSVPAAAPSASGWSSAGHVGVAHAPSVSAGAVAAPATGADAWLRSNGLAVNVDTRTVVVDGRNVDLTRTEFDLVASLLTTGRRVRSKADLVLTLRGQNYVTTYFVNEADKRAVEVHMANIRRKLGDSSTTPRWIETVRGVGYRMAEDG